MTEDDKALTELATRVEALDGAPDYFNPINEEIVKAIGWRFVREGHPIGCVWYRPDGRASCVPNFTGSLDAALSLVPEGWSTGLGDLHGYAPPIWRAHLRDHNNPNPARRQWIEGHAATPALTLTAAALRALAAQAGA